VPPVQKIVTISGDSSSDSDDNDFDQCDDTNGVVVNEVSETAHHGNYIDTTESDDNSMQTSQSTASCSRMCTSLTETSDDECDDCQEICCRVEQNSQPFQPRDAATINALGDGGRNFMPKWYNSYQWLTVCKSRKRVFCFYCRYAVKQNMLTFSKRAEPTFSINGFKNWRKALDKCDTYQSSAAHREAMLKWELTTKQIPIDVQFDSKVSKLQARRRQCLLKQLDSSRYLLHQGMAIRGHAEKDGNLYHLLLHMAKYDSDLQQWIDNYRYMSHDIITKLIALMGQSLLRQILHNIHHPGMA